MLCWNAGEAQHRGRGRNAGTGPGWRDRCITPSGHMRPERDRYSDRGSRTRAADRLKRASEREYGLSSSPLRKRRANGWLAKLVKAMWYYSKLRAE